MDTKTWYAQITVKAFVSDTDGIIEDSKIKTFTVASRNPDELMYNSAMRVKEQLRESTNKLSQDSKND